MAGLSNGVFIDTFDPAECHPDIQLLTFNRTAAGIGSENYTCVLGATTYSSGKHDIYLRLDHVDNVNIVLIGMTSNSFPPLEGIYHAPGMSAWLCDETAYVTSNDGLQEGGDVGQPWMNGDVIHLHLDCGRHTLRACHELTGKTHKIRNITGDQRLFIVLYSLGTVTLI